MRSTFVHRGGFSLIEVLVVVGFIGILSTIAVVRFTSSTQSSQLRDAVRVVRADIERAQSFAHIGATCCSGVLPEGYGIVVNENQDIYALYAEFGGNHQYDASTDTIVSGIDLSVTELFLRADISAGNSAGSISFSACEPVSLSGTCDIFFASPSGEAYTNGERVTDFLLTLTHVQQPWYESIGVDIDSGKIE